MALSAGIAFAVSLIAWAVSLLLSFAMAVPRADAFIVLVSYAVMFVLGPNCAVRVLAKRFAAHPSSGPEAEAGSD